MDPIMGDATPEQPTPDVVETPAVDVGQPGATPTPEPTSAETPEAVTTPEPEQYRLPGESVDEPQDSDWLQQQYAAALTEMAQLRQRLEEFELAGLSEEEASQLRFEREKQAWQQQMNQWQQAQAVNEWRTYYQQWTPLLGETGSQQLSMLRDPVQMGHHVVTTLASQVKALQAENAALKKSAGMQASGPKVTTGGQGGVSRKSLMDIWSNQKEWDALTRKAKMGLLTDSDIPG